MKGRLGALAATALLIGCGNDPDDIMVGTIERDRIELVATYAEPIVHHLVREGDTVTAGALLSEQSSTRLDAQQRAAEAERDRLEARLKELVRGPRKESIREAMARIDRLEAGRREADLEKRRVAELQAKSFASTAEVDAATARLDAAVASLKEANATLDALVTGTTAEELAQARSALAAAVARVDEIAENRSRLRHVAPADALVESLPYEEGETPPVGAPVVVLLRAGMPYARIYVSEPLRAQVKAGNTLDVHVDGIDKSFAGQVRYVSSEASFTPYFALTRYDRARLAYVAEVNLPDGVALPAGLPVEAQIRREPTR